VLLVLFAVEGVTLLAMHQLLSVHIVVGTLLVPPVLLKTVTTGWRAARYYLGSRVYVEAGPPPLVLRVLGPLVVLTTVGALASGLLLILVGPEGKRPVVAPLGFGISLVTVHQGWVVAWLVVTAVHVLGRVVPALRVVSSGRVALTAVPDVAQRLRGTAAPSAEHRPEADGGHPTHVPGRGLRVAAVVLALAIGAGASVVVLRAASDWTSQDFRRPPFPGAPVPGQRPDDD
jgi:hypothetical protein